MIPSDLKAESFSRYPAQARAFAAANLDVLRRIPLSLLPVVLRQLIRYDWCFPPEQAQLDRQFHLLADMDKASFDSLMAPFAAIQLSSDLLAMDWVNQPQAFSEQMTAWLWSQHQIDSYHQAAQRYQQRMEQAFEEKPPATPRLTIVVVGHSVEQTNRQLFRKLAPHGTLFTQVNPADGMNILLDTVRTRAQQHPLSYGHWYIDGGVAHPSSNGVEGLSVMSYAKLASVARRELTLIQEFTAKQGSLGDGKVGAEAVTSYMLSLGPDELGVEGASKDDRLRHFEVNVLTQGAGCQIYSTTFVQWSSRECLHRAQPITLLARFGTRQVSAPMEQLLARDPLQQPQDIDGSLVDADMGAYYTWINQSRLAGADQSRFLAWFENHNLAFASSPNMPHGNTSSSAADLRQILAWL